MRVESDFAERPRMTRKAFEETLLGAFFWHSREDPHVFLYQMTMACTLTPEGVDDDTVVYSSAPEEEPGVTLSYADCWERVRSARSPEFVEPRYRPPSHFAGVFNETSSEDRFATSIFGGAVVDEDRAAPYLEATYRNALAQRDAAERRKKAWRSLAKRYWQEARVGRALWNMLGGFVDVWMKAENYAGTDVVDKRGKWALSAQRFEGKTPNERLQELKRERDEALMVIESEDDAAVYAEAWHEASRGPGDPAWDALTAEHRDIQVDGAKIFIARWRALVRERRDFMVSLYSDQAKTVACDHCGRRERIRRHGQLWSGLPVGWMELIDAAVDRRLACSVACADKMNETLGYNKDKPT